MVYHHHVVEEIPKPEIREIKILPNEVAEIENSNDNIAISIFPGEAGGIEENVNRWRKQLTLPAQNFNQFKKDIMNSPFFGDYYIFHETNTNNSIIAAIIQIKNL